MFALVLDRDPMKWVDFPVAFQSWLISAGGVCVFLLWVITLATLLRTRRPDLRLGFIAFLPLLAPPVFVCLWFFWTMGRKWTQAEKSLNLPFLTLSSAVTVMLLLLGGLWLILQADSVVGMYLVYTALALALGVVVAPIIVSACTRMRWGRIWALARLSLMEAVRSRVVMVFALMVLVFLFADWFVPFKQEDQVRNYVRIVYWSMTPLFLITAAILGAFSIPTDIKNQSIHTIVTKPVERLEIVLGRFLGYGILLTAGAVVLAVVSYLYILRGVTPEAREESVKARVPIYGNLFFYDSTKGEQKSQVGENVGREWGYRSYISGQHITDKSNARRTYMTWEFEDLPADLSQGDESASFEFTFDIFRLNKGLENKGVFCTFMFALGGYTPPQLEKLQVAVKDAVSDFREKSKTPPTPAEVEEHVLSRFVPYFELAGVEVTDYHTQKLKVPAAFFKKLRETVLQREELIRAKEEKQREPIKRPPQLVVTVNVEKISHSQLVGAAKHDLYLLATEQPFVLNFFKGIIGMWFSYLLVLGVAITCSTYLSGVISWLVTLFLYGAGTCNDYIQQLASNRSLGGGPFESIKRLAENKPITVPLDGTPTNSIIVGADDVYRYWLQLFLHIIPDVNRFDLHLYVANGFDIAWSRIIFLDNFLYLGGYLLPWVILAFYLMKFREVANPT